MANEFQVVGKSEKALFTLKAHRGDGMLLLAMNWKKGKPPTNFVGFAIEYKEPGEAKFFVLKNRLGFPGAKPIGKVGTTPQFSSLDAPFQKFRWVHFPRNADLDGKFHYKVTPVFMDDANALNYGDPQTVDIALCRETYPGQLNVGFTRGFVASQAFVENYKAVRGILPGTKDKPLSFKPTAKNAENALTWMGFEARKSILEVLDKAIADTRAKVCVVAYDLNLPEIVDRLEQLGDRVRVIIDNSGSHARKGSPENDAEKRLLASAGPGNVIREHMGGLQHNKFIVVNGSKAKFAVCGSTNFSWRAFYVQNNNAVVVEGAKAIQPFLDVFENYWTKPTVKSFAPVSTTKWTSLGLTGINAKISFSPHGSGNALLADLAKDIQSTASSLFYSLAFLYETPGPILKAVNEVTNDENRFVYGISDKKVGGIILEKPDGNLAPVYPSQLTKNLPEPFKSEPTGGAGARMHHKFVVIDFDKPSARVYFGSYNFSDAADTKNGENLVLVKDKRIAVSYMVEALSIFDHYHFRVVQNTAKKKGDALSLALPPKTAEEKAWWDEDYTVPIKIRDRKMFA